MMSNAQNKGNRPAGVIGRKDVMKVTKVVLRGCYSLAGEYLPFDDNPHHGKTYNDVAVSVETKFKSQPNGRITAREYVKIEGCEPIECEIVGYKVTDDGTLVISICQDWG